ncbi:UNVERIFIED_CONTAM: hypothetical protein HDU68_009903 [Siphonaria sp. JEL0065]|nr:hypothetical protein HDU68_009903 [Siphonaria sp. JEL0065]
MPLASRDSISSHGRPPPPLSRHVSEARIIVRHVPHSTALEILLHALRASLRASVLGYSIRSGLLFLLRLLRVARGKMPIVKAIKESFLGLDSVRMAGFFATFAFVWKAVNNAIISYRSGKDNYVNAFTSGAVAGALACLVEQKQWRIDMAQQLIVRGLSTAQVMYGYVMRPESIPESYYKFILNTGPIPEDVLKICRQQLGGKTPLDAASVMQTVVRHKGTQHAILEASGLTEFPDCVPCGVLHPPVDSCNSQMGLTLVKVLRAILPVYASLNFVPMVVLKTRELFRRPQALLQRGLKNTVRSSMFLAVFVAVFMRIACLQRTLVTRNILPRDNRYLFWINGFISSSAILIEDEKRRSELAMYVLPRGMDALYKTLYAKSWIFHIPHFDVGMFGVAMGLIIGYYQTEPEALGGIIYRLLRRIDLTIEDADGVVDLGGEVGKPARDSCVSGGDGACDEKKILGNENIGEGVEVGDPRDRVGTI